MERSSTVMHVSHTDTVTVTVEVDTPSSTPQFQSLLQHQSTPQAPPGFLPPPPPPVTQPIFDGSIALSWATATPTVPLGTPSHELQYSAPPTGHHHAPTAGPYHGFPPPLVTVGAFPHHQHLQGYPQPSMDHSHGHMSLPQTYQSYPQQSPMAPYGSIPSQPVYSNSMIPVLQPSSIDRIITLNIKNFITITLSTTEEFLAWKTQFSMRYMSSFILFRFGIV